MKKASVILPKGDLDPIDHLRRAVNVFDGCNETFNQRWTVDELFLIYKAHQESEWDFYPDQWTPRQLKEALKGIPPQWDGHERPVYRSARLVRGSGG